MGHRSEGESIIYCLQGCGITLQIDDITGGYHGELLTS